MQLYKSNFMKYLVKNLKNTFEGVHFLQRCKLLLYNLSQNKTNLIV